ncbi:hypothetical protein EVAR_31587_1 [Eumeta japonica]|uniref:Uncharacterized protein n=1 Tax=Eumeta variegata TaxID=151549 RepID=A0A4C1V8V4_EUMVA|nr:hypothetical protein EVAR_31587_1 [Eumeta japonica]
MDTRNPRGVINALPASYVEIGYPMEEGLIVEKWGSPWTLLLHGRDTTPRTALNINLADKSLLQVSSVRPVAHDSMFNRLDENVTESLDYQLALYNNVFRPI